MKYRELISKLQTLTPEQLETQVTIAVDNSGVIEFQKSTDFVGEHGKWPSDACDRDFMFVNEAENVLANNHPFLTVIL